MLPGLNRSNWLPPEMELHCSVVNSGGPLKKLRVKTRKVGSRISYCKVCISKVVRGIAQAFWIWRSFLSSSSRPPTGVTLARVVQVPSRVLQHPPPLSLNHHPNRSELSNLILLHFLFIVIGKKLFNRLLAKPMKRQRERYFSLLFIPVT